MRNHVERQQGTACCILPQNRVVYIDSNSRCVLGEFHGSGGVREVTVLGENVVTLSANPFRTHVVVVTESDCRFWSVADSPAEVATVALGQIGEPFYAQLSDSGRHALLALSATSNDSTLVHIVVADKENPNELIEVETADEFMELRFEWVRGGVALISSASTRAAVGQRVYDIRGQPILESTRLYAINEGRADELQRVDIGGQWVARSGNHDHICIVSTNAIQSGNELIGSVFRISEAGWRRA